MNQSEQIAIDEVENLWFLPFCKTVDERSSRRVASSKQFLPPPIGPGPAPYHLDLSAVLPKRAQAILQSGKHVFHAVGDTGDVNGTGAQQDVADQMTGQIERAESREQPSFLYHLGDVIYYNGEARDYSDQFYFPYMDYPAPIFAIPGNHDGNTPDPSQTLRPFLSEFCAPYFHHSDKAMEAPRPTMTQPNCYRRLNAPFLTVIGLYSNVTGELDNIDAGGTTQQEWLEDQLRSAPVDRALAIAVHHPPYSLGKHLGTIRIRAALKQAIRTSGRVPDLILAGHEHCYQRFDWKILGRRIPLIVAGAGGFAGFDNLTKVDKSLELPKKVKLKASNDRRPGFLRISVTADTLTGEYYTIPKAGARTGPQNFLIPFPYSCRMVELDLAMVMPFNNRISRKQNVGGRRHL